MNSSRLEGPSNLGSIVKNIDDIRVMGVAAIVVVMIAIAVPGLAVLLIFCAILIVCYRKKGHHTSGTHGTARWAADEDLRNSSCYESNGGFLIGRTIPFSKKPTNRRDIYVPDWKYPHLQVVGPSGSGKSTCFSIRNLLTDDRASCVCIDPKGEIFRTTAEKRARRLNHEIVVIDPFRIVGEHEFTEGRINPLCLYENKPDLIADDARRLANSLIVRTLEERDPFWPKSAQSVTQSVIAFQMSELRPEEANLNRLRDILTDGEMLEEVLQHMSATDACHGLLRRMAGHIRQLKGQTAASVFSVANSHLEFLDSVAIGRILTDTSFDVRRILSNEVTIYLCLPVDRIVEVRGLLRILVTSLINYVFQAGESKTRRVRLLLDEAASLGEIDSLYNAIMFGRGFGLRATLMFQSASQVAQCFPESKAADYKGTVASVFCGVNDFEGAEEVSKWIGQTTVSSYSSQSSTNWGTSTSQGTQELQRGSNQGGGDSYSHSQIGRSLIQPEEILQLPSHLGIALLPNVRPIMFEKVPYFAKSTSRKQSLPRIGPFAMGALILILTMIAVAMVQQLESAR
jgi:type IV secretion system protein VirD4